jgi:phage gp29-like protein
MNIFKRIGSVFSDPPASTDGTLSERMQQMLAIMATRQAFQYSNVFELLPNPDKILRDQNKTIDEYSGFKYDAHVYSCIQSRKSAVLALEWQINKGGEETEISRFINDIFSRLDLRRIESEMLDAPFYGYKPLEIYWMVEDGYIVPRDVVGKPPHWFAFDSFNLLRFCSMAAPNGSLVPPRKFLLLTNEATYDNPYGEAVLAKCFYPVIFKKGGMKLWATFTEKYGMPYLHGKLLTGSTAKDFDNMLVKLMGLRQDGVLVTEEDASVEIKESARNAPQEIYKQLLHFCNAEISKAILSQTLTTEQGETGSYAMSQTHLQVRSDVVDNDKRMVEAAFNRLIEWIVDMNFANPVEYPKFEMYEMEDVDKALAERDAILVPVLQQSGKKLSTSYLISAYNLKDTDLEDAPIPTPAAPAMPFSEFADKKQIEELAKIGSKDFAKSFDLILKPVLEMINAGQSFEELQKNVIKIFPKLKTEQVEKLIAKGILISGANGILDSQQSLGK